MAKTRRDPPTYRDLAIQALDRLAPHVVGNPYIPHWPHPKQIELLGAHLKAKDKTRPYEVLFGGGLGGGKTDGLLMAAAQYVHEPGYHAIIFRRTHSEMIQPGAILDRALEWWIPTDAKWNSNSHIFTFPSGAKIAFGYLENDKDAKRYYGADYSLIAFDELTHWPTPGPYKFVSFTRNRQTLENAHIPRRIISTSNPGSAGHAWVKSRFMSLVDSETNQPIDPGNIEFIPSLLRDNPTLDYRSYQASIAHLHPTLQAQMLHGDWDAREPGDFFRREWFGPMLDPAVDMWPMAECRRVRSWDLAASEREGAAYTAGVRMARHVSGCRAIESMLKFRKTPGERDNLIVQTAEIDGRGTIVHIEIEGGSGGIAQYLALEKRLKAKGFQVHGDPPRSKTPRTALDSLYTVRNPSAPTAKMLRAVPVAAALRRGWVRRGESDDPEELEYGEDRGKSLNLQKDGVRLFAGNWTGDFLDAVEGFPDTPYFDVVDAVSGAFSFLEAHPAGTRKPPLPPRIPVRVTHDTHPDDIPDEPSSRRFRV